VYAPFSCFAFCTCSRVATLLSGYMTAELITPPPAPAEPQATLVDKVVSRAG